MDELIDQFMSLDMKTKFYPYKQEYTFGNEKECTDSAEMQYAVFLKFLNASYADIVNFNLLDQSMKRYHEYLGAVKWNSYSHLGKKIKQNIKEYLNSKNLDTFKRILLMKEIDNDIFTLYEFY